MVLDVQEATKRMGANVRDGAALVVRSMELGFCAMDPQLAEQVRGHKFQLEVSCWMAGRAALLLCCSAAVLLCCSAALLLCCSAALLLCCSAALLLCCSAALLLCCSAALLLCTNAACCSEPGPVRGL
jgi:hypothetical protein